MEIALHVNNLTSLRLFSEEPYHEWYAKAPRNPIEALLSDCFAATCVWHMRMARPDCLASMFKRNWIAPQTPPLHTTNSLCIPPLSLYKGLSFAVHSKQPDTPPFTPPGF